MVTRRWRSSIGSQCQQQSEYYLVDAVTIVREWDWRPFVMKPARMKARNQYQSPAAEAEAVMQARLRQRPIDAALIAPDTVYLAPIPNSQATSPSNRSW